MTDEDYENWFAWKESQFDECYEDFDDYLWR